MTTRRDAVRILGAAAAGTWVARSGCDRAFAFQAKTAQTPPLAPGSPLSPERTALIETFKKESDGLEKLYEARTHKSDLVMPYRLFRPQSAGRLPLVVYLHGGGAVGNDNEKQLGLGNIYGTRVWLLPRNQKQFPCYVVVPQTDSGWTNYDPTETFDGRPKPVPGLGTGARLALQIIDRLCREFPIDERRIYVTGQSLGGSGTWHLTAHRPGFFAAAAPCCGAETTEDPVKSRGTPLWNFHGGADQTVPVRLSRERIAALEKAGVHPLYTEYAGVDHNVWQWAYTEPELLKWMFAHRT
jgi:predicted peptidase